MVTMLAEPPLSIAGDRKNRLIRVSGIVDQSIADGPGLRLAVFTQGCPHRCSGCHNPSTHSLDQGFGCSVEEIMARFDENPLLAGITLSGGEPLLQPDALLRLAELVRKRGKNIWCYTGYTFEDLLDMINENRPLHNLLQCIDVLVDGRYEAALRSLALPYRGSSNQRLLDLPPSLARKRAILWK